MSDVEIKVSGEMVKGIVEAKLQAAILRELSQNPQTIIDGIVASAFNMKVDETGKVNRDSWYNKHNWVKQAVEIEISRIAKESLVKWVEGQQEQIEKAMLKELSKSRDAMVKSFVESFTKSAQNTYGFKVEIKPPADR